MAHYAATLSGVALVARADDIGTIALGKKADLLMVDENPLANFNVLYGTGHHRLNRASGRMERTRGIRYTVKDGIVFDARKLLGEVKALVEARKEIEAKVTK